MEFVSRDSLVEEITGIKKDYMAWDSAKQTIANIDNALRKISSYNDTIGIPDFNKDSYIKRMSVIYNDFNLRSVIYKLGRGEKLSKEEDLLLLNFAKEYADNPILYKIYNKREESILAEELTIKFDEIHSDITNLMMLTDGLIYEHRLRIAECLREDILELIEVYETQIQVEQEATKKLMDMINRHIDRDVKEYKEKNNYPIKRKR